MIVVYCSKSGSSERYAREFASRTGFECFSFDDKLPQDGPIVFFGWLRADTIVGIRGIDTTRLKAVCVVGLDDPSRFNRSSVSEKNGVRVPVYYMRGWIDRSKLGIADKAILLAVSVMMKLKGLDGEGEKVFDAMMNGGSFYDPAYLDPVIRFCGGRD